MPPTPEQLDLAAVTVGFELSAAVRAEVALRTTQDSEVQMLNLEAGPLHLRQVGTFVFGDRKGSYRSNDIKPSDFLVGLEAWSAAQRDRDTWHDEFAPTINRHLMHLTWDRITLDWTRIPFARSLEHVQETLDGFVTHLGRVGAQQHQQFYVALESSFRISANESRRSRHDIVPET